MTLFIQALLNGILLGGVYATYSVGFSLVFGVMGIVNIAHGDLVMLGAFFSYWAYQIAKIDPFLGIPFAGITLFALGYVLQRFIINRVVDAPPIISYTSTFGIHLIITNLALMAWSADYRSVAVPYTGSNFSVGGVVVQWTRLATSIVGVILVLSLTWLLNRTFIGRAIKAASQDMELARVMGVNPEKVYALTFALGSTITGIAGVLISTFFVIYPAMGMPYTVTAFCVVVLGGMGYVPGALVGGFVLGMIESLTSTYMGSGVSSVVTFLALFLMLITRPRGLTGKGAEA